jgi:hypothetical protein
MREKFPQHHDAVEADFARELERELNFIRAHCRVVFYPSDGRYPIEHTMAARKDQFDAIIAEMKPDRLGIEAEQPLLSNDEMFEALGRAMGHIERGGANVELTSAVIAVDEVRRAIGNRWIPASKEYAAMVRAKIAEREEHDASARNEENHRKSC